VPPRAYEGRGSPSLRQFRYSCSVLALSEKALIARVRRLVGNESRIVAGIGDDSAVLRIPAGHEALITTDFSLEGIHFRRDWHPPESVGHRCLARGLSDIAAMGGEPIAVFLSLALPRKLPRAWVERFTLGLLNLARRFGVTLAGGDTAESPQGILADIAVLGSVPRGGAVLRSSASPGDRIFVSGKIGGSAAAINCLLQGKARKLHPKNFPFHFFPQPRLELGRLLRERKLATSMIDVSDGLSTDLAHICEESGVGAEIQATALPLAAIGKPPRTVDLNFALHGGDDYELLFTTAPGKRIHASLAGVAVTQIGSITRERRVILKQANGLRRELKPGGWEHFRNRK
jgi:thiamine-monophosphate kinase